MFDKIMANAPPSFYFDAIPPPAHGHIAERSVPPLRFPARTSVRSLSVTNQDATFVPVFCREPSWLPSAYCFYNAFNTYVGSRQSYFINTGGNHDE